MLSALFSPSGLTHAAKLTGLLTGLTVVVGVPGVWLSRWSSGGLGETGVQFLLGVTLLAGLWSLLMAGVYVTFQRPRAESAAGLAISAERRKVSALALFVGGLIWAEGFNWFIKQFLTVHGPLGEFVLAADWLGIPLRVPREEFTSQDLFTVLLLLLSAASLARSWYAHYFEGFQSRLPAPLLGFMAFGFLYLAFDEFFMIHELLGANMLFLKEIPFVKQPDDVVMLGYLVGAGLVLLPHLPRLRDDQLSRWILLFALGTQGLAALADGFFPRSLWRIEESAEILAAGCYLLFAQRAGSNASLTIPLTASEEVTEAAPALDTKLSGVLRA